MEDAKTHRERLYNEHLVDKYLTRIAEKSQYLLELYQDKDG
jgi:splicing factor 3A subunit 3